MKSSQLFLGALLPVLLLLGPASAGDLEQPPAAGSAQPWAASHAETGVASSAQAAASGSAPGPAAESRPATGTNRLRRAEALAARLLLAAPDEAKRARQHAALLQALQALQGEGVALRDEVAAQGRWLRSRGAPAQVLDRQSRLEAELQARVQALEAAVQDWQSRPGDTTLRALHALLLAQQPARRDRAGARQPWGVRQAPDRGPATSRAEWQEMIASDARVRLARASTRSMGAVQFTTEPPAGEAPQPADLAETAEIVFTPAIRAQAQALGGNPVAIANWVRASIGYAPTWGAMQTADAVLRSRRGNAVDTATLAVALLRASGIPARYQFGTVDVPADAALGWFGGAADAAAALALLRQGGVAAQGLEDAGRFRALRMEHAWVLAYVNWTPGRGARDGGAHLAPPQHPNPDARLNAWVPLDLAYKQQPVQGGMDLPSLASFNAQAVLDATRQGARCTAASAAGLNAAALAAHHSAFKTQAQAQLGATGVRVEQVLGSQAITAAPQPLLAGTLAHPVAASHPALAEISPSLRWRLQLALSDAGQDVLTLDRPLAQLQGRQLALGFVPRSSEDAQTLAALLRPGVGGDPKTGLPPRAAAYLVQLKAQLLLDGELLVEGGSFTLGQPLALRTLLQHPQDSASSDEAILLAGETHVWSIRSGAGGSAHAAAAGAGLAALQARLQSPGAPPGAASQTRTLLHALAEAYQASLDANARLQQRAASMLEERLPSIVRASTRLEAEQALGLVIHVRPGGIGLHADRLASATAASRDGLDTAAISAYASHGLQRASAAAHQLLDGVLATPGQGATAQSALSSLARASQQGLTVWRADAANLAQVLAEIDTGSAIREPLQQAVLNGQQALLAAAATQAGGLAVDPLVLLDLQGGTASYSVFGRTPPQDELTAQRPGPAGWIGLADDAATAILVGPVLPPLSGRLATLQALLGDTGIEEWRGFAGRDEVLDTLYVLRITAAADLRQACDWLATGLAAQLAGGLAGSSSNRPPLITSQAPTRGSSDSAYAYAAQANDPEGDALAWRLGAAPAGMRVDAAGRVSWAQPTVGQHAITLLVSDGRAVAEQSFTLEISAAASASLQVGISLQPSVALAGQTVTLQVSASSQAGAALTRAATLSGRPLALDAQGGAVFAAPAAGAHPVVVVVRDGQRQVTREAVLTVKNPLDAAPPVATIAQPLPGASLRGRVVISGTATDANFAWYQLLARRAGDAETAWQEVGRGLAPVSNGALGEIDTSRMANGAWEIGLRVVDVNGAHTMARVPVELAGDLKLGQFRLAFTDIRAEGPGLPLLLTRSYDSANKDVAGDFGYGWTASGQDLSVRKNMVVGLAWQVQARQLQLCLVPEGRRRITITLPDGGLYRFEASNTQECAFAQIPQVEIQFTPLPAPSGGSAGRVNATAQLRVVGPAQLEARGGMLMNMDTGEAWDPTDFELTTPEGMRYQLREGVGILAVIDPWGNHVTYGREGYHHSANLGIALTRDAQGRITQATDPAGRSVHYAYNAEGELESVTDREGRTTRFGYSSVPGSNGSGASGNQDQLHLLASITDPDGKRVLANQFDSSGRLAIATDALGQASRQEYDPAQSTQTVVDRRGNRTVYRYDAEGNVTEVVNALGEKATFTHDANGNETSVTNALGQTTSRQFDAQSGLPTIETNSLGHATYTSYASVGAASERLNPLSSTDARGNTTTFTYADPRQPGAVPARIDEPLGRSTTLEQDRAGNLSKLDIAGEQRRFEYDRLGRKTRETDGLGNSTGFTYDAQGNETGRTYTQTVNGQVLTRSTTRKYDAENRVIEEIDAAGGKRSYTWNAAGRLATETDGLGRVTTHHYDANARLVRTDHPDGSSETIEYDAEGNETIRTDRAGRSTRMAYDALNRLTTTTYPDGSSESTTYDAAGRIASTTDRRGGLTTLEYDAAGRQTGSVDSTGRRTTQTHDENGNRTSITVDGRSTRFEYDALNRLTRTTFPDGSTHTSSYRPDNRKESETDPRGVTTSYGWDAAGRLVSVSQSLSATTTATTTYGYDETGAKVSQVDALGRTTTWTIDANGRVTARKIQDGSQESSQYDSEGNRLQKRTFAGEQLSWQYDSSSRVTGQVVPAGTGSNAGVPGAVIAYTYSASGQLQSHQEQGATTLQGTQQYRYDSNDRLVEISNPIGRIGYTLDAEGNITERSIAGVGTTKYEYDAAGRMTVVTAPDGKQARYTYDAAGRPSTTERDLAPKDGAVQVLVTHQRYDAADRMVAIAHVRKTGAAETLIAGQSITRATGGAVTAIATYREGASYDTRSGQFGGTPSLMQAFEHDANARLTRETRTKAGSTIDTRYDYDAAGNRTKKSVTTASGTDVTSYSYDSSDRLTVEETVFGAGGTRSISYTWDDNGNLASKTEPGKVTLYRFDPQNRLIDMRTGVTRMEANSAAPNVSYAYDAAGNRVRKGGANAGIYLTDSSSAVPEVRAEKRGGDTIDYVRGSLLLRQTKVAGSTKDDMFPLHGHLGTSLGAVDMDGNLVEQISADAFGVLEQPTGLRQTHLYTGQYWDQDAQLLYLHARWYDPNVGRFISLDPAEGKQTDPRSLNRMAYAHNDPVHNTDPTGEMSLGETGAAMNIMSTLAVNAVRDFGLNMVMEQIGKTLIGAFGSKHTVGNWGGSPGGAALISALANLCYFNERSCLLRGIPTLANGVEMPGTTFHILESLSGEAKTRFGFGRALPFLLGRVAPQPRSFLDKECPKPRPGGLWCDEYPYSSTLQGGPLNYMAGGVSARLVPMAEQWRQRNLLNNFYRGAKIDAGGVSPTSLFLNVVTPLPSFYIDRTGKKHQL